MVSTPYCRLAYVGETDYIYIYMFISSEVVHVHIVLYDVVVVDGGIVIHTHIWLVYWHIRLV